MNLHCLYCGKACKETQEVQRTNGWRLFHVLCKLTWRAK